MVLSKVVPIFSIYGVKNNYYVPLVFFLLSNKFSGTYTKAFRLIHNYLKPRKNICGL